MIPIEQPKSGQISRRVSVLSGLFVLFRLLLLLSLFLLLLPFRFGLALRMRPFRLRIDSRRRRDALIRLL